ncbi:hypothetical protein HDV04_005058 [Boothiomyces sp. JEL0838]|nr:hypothetical protein HDV04_005058 [Boothiomyces sp. JEL0838]
MNTPIEEETITLDQLMEDEFQDHDQPGYYVAIGDYYHSNQLKVSLGDVIKVTSINNDYCYGINQNTNEQGLLPLDILVQLSKEVFQPQDLFEDESEGELISMNELNSLSLDYTTHCLETENETSIYFAWRYGGESVAVWGSFNDWQRPIQLFYDSVTTIFVCFAETHLQHGELCFFKFVVDDQYQVDHTLPTVTNEDGTFNYIVICTRYCQGKEHEIDIQQVHQIVSNQSMTEYDFTKEIQFNDVSVDYPTIAVESVELQEIHEEKETLTEIEAIEAIPSELSLQFRLHSEDQEEKRLSDIPSELFKQQLIKAENDEELRLQELEILEAQQLESLKSELAVEAMVSQENEKAIAETVDSIPAELVQQIQMDAENQEAVRLQSRDVKIQSNTTQDIENSLVFIPLDLSEEIRINAENQEAIKLQNLEIEKELYLQQLKLELQLEMRLTKENELAIGGHLDLIPEELSIELCHSAENDEAARLHPRDNLSDINSYSLSAELLEELRILAENQEAIKLQELEIQAELEFSQLKHDLNMEMHVTRENELAINETPDEIPKAAVSENPLKDGQFEEDLYQMPLDLSEDLRIEAENREAVRLQNIDIQAIKELETLRETLQLESKVVQENQMAINFVETIDTIPLELSHEIRIGAENDEAVKLQNYDILAEEQLQLLKKQLQFEYLVSKENESALSHVDSQIRMPEELADEFKVDAENKESLKLQEQDFSTRNIFDGNETQDNDFVAETKAREIAIMEPAGLFDSELGGRNVKIQIEEKGSLKVELSSGEDYSDFDSHDGFEIAHVNADMYSTTAEYLAADDQQEYDAASSKRSSSVARQELVAHFHHTELEFESELADLRNLAKSSHYNEKFVDALKQEASRFAKNLYRLDALLGKMKLILDDIDSPYKTAFSHKLEKEIFGESLDEILPEHVMLSEMLYAEDEQERFLMALKEAPLEIEMFGDSLHDILPDAVIESERIELENSEELKHFNINISNDIEKQVFGEKIEEFLPDNLLVAEKVLFEDSVIASRKIPSSPALAATREILKDFARSSPEQVVLSKKDSRDDFDYSAGTPDDDDRLSYEEYTEHSQLEHHLDRISNILNLVKNPPKENYSNALPVDLIRSLQLASEEKEETKIGQMEDAENDLIDEIMDRFESTVEGTFAEWRFVTSVDHIEFHEETEAQEKHLSIQTDVAYSSGASSSDTVIDSPVFEKFTLKKSPSSPQNSSSDINSLPEVEENVDSQPVPYLPPTIPLPNIPATPSLVQSVPRNPTQPVFDPNRMSDLIDSLSKDEFPSSSQPQVQAPPNIRPKSRTTSKPFYVPSPLSFPPITRQETEESSSPEPSSPSNSTKEAQVWEEIPLTPSPTLVTDPSTSMFSPVIDKYISIALAVACIANIKLLLSILSASWMVIRIFHMVWTFAGLVFLFGHLL